jgi:hypothetical protein
MHIPSPLNSEILKWANRNHELLSTGDLNFYKVIFEIYSEFFESEDIISRFIIGVPLNFQKQMKN